MKEQLYENAYMKLIEDEDGERLPLQASKLPNGDILFDFAALHPELLETGWKEIEVRAGNVILKILKHPDDKTPDNLTFQAGVWQNTENGKVGLTLEEVV